MAFSLSDRWLDRVISLLSIQVALSCSTQHTRLQEFMPSVDTKQRISFALARTANYLNPLELQV